jgi:hypothetical protein
MVKVARGMSEELIVQRSLWKKRITINRVK